MAVPWRYKCSLGEPTNQLWVLACGMIYIAAQRDGMHTMLMEAVNRQININNPHKDKPMILSQLYYIQASFFSLLNSVLTMRFFYKWTEGKRSTQAQIR